MDSSTSVAADTKRIAQLEMTSRHHHYLSQCYLKGFTNGGSKKSKLTVIDLGQKKHFDSIPRNVGGLRDFNRIDVEGVDQNALEESLAEFEGAAATALRKIDEGENFAGELKDLVLYLIALLAVRSPEKREHWRQFQAQNADTVMGITLATKERWESQIKQMKKSGKEVDESVSYEDAKAFHESKNYTIEVSREHHIRMEFVGLEAILPFLDGRKWQIVKSTLGSGPLITSDRPVVLMWKDPDKIPRLYRDNPGFGMKDTRVYFPLSKSTALVGEFDGNEGVIEGTRGLISVFNSQILSFTHKQVYAPNLAFYFRGKDGILFDGRYLLRRIGA